MAPRLATRSLGKVALSLIVAGKQRIKLLLDLRKGCELRQLFTWVDRFGRIMVLQLRYKELQEIVVIDHRLLQHGC